MRITYSLIVFLFASVCAAQPAAADPTPIPRIEIRTLGLTRGIQTDLYYHNTEGFEKLPLAYYRPSATLRAAVDENGNLPLFSRVTTPEGEIQFLLHSRVAVPAGSRQILILGAQNEERVVMNAVADNLSDSSRDWLFINISQMPVAVELGEGNPLLLVPPSQSVFHEAQVVSGEGASIHVVVYKENAWERVYSRFWPIYSNQRNMVVFLESAGEIQVVNFFEPIRSSETR